MLKKIEKTFLKAPTAEDFKLTEEQLQYIERLFQWQENSSKSNHVIDNCHELPPEKTFWDVVYRR